MGGDVTMAFERGTLQFDGGPSQGHGLEASTEVTGKARFDVRARILVVDDGPDSQRLLRIQLEDAGASVVGAVSGRMAIDLSTKHAFDLILMDILMPIMDGHATTTELRRQGITVPIIALTGFETPGMLEKCIASGCDSYLPKSADEDTLLAMVSQYLGTQLRANKLEGSVRPELAVKAESTSLRAKKAIRILIAEDSSDGQALLQPYMSGDPYSLAFVEDGEGAVQAFAAADFDLVLTDRQMPEMDGLCATQPIRELERVRGSSTPIPILALTANSSPQDVEMSRQAGCNEHLSKPVSTEALLSIIGNHAGDATPRVTAIPSLEPILIEVPPGLEAICPGYLAARQGELPELLGLLDASDFEGVAFLAHNMKGTGKSYGFTELSRIGIEMEQSARRNDSLPIRLQLAELVNYCDRVELIQKLSSI